MTRGTISIPKETIEYNFALIEGLKFENTKLKEVINEVLDVLNGNGVPNNEWIKNRLAESLR